MSMAMRRGLLWLAGNESIRQFLTRSPISRQIAKRFVAGDTAEEALDITARINAKGMAVALDYLGESVTQAHEAAAVRDTYVGLIDEIARRNLRCYASVKLTALGLDITRKECISNLRIILQAARQHGIFVRLDMEGSDYTQPTIDILEQMYCNEGFKNAGVVADHGNLPLRRWF